MLTEYCSKRRSAFCHCTRAVSWLCFFDSMWSNGVRFREHWPAMKCNPLKIRVLLVPQLNNFDSRAVGLMPVSGVNYMHVRLSNSGLGGGAHDGVQGLFFGTTKIACLREIWPWPVKNTGQKLCWALQETKCWRVLQMRRNKNIVFHIIIYRTIADKGTRFSPVMRSWEPEQAGSTNYRQLWTNGTKLNQLL